MEELTDDYRAFDFIFRIVEYFMKRKDDFVFYHYADPEKMKMDYLKKHKIMERELHLKDEEDPYDNLRIKERKKLKKQQNKNKHNYNEVMSTSNVSLFYKMINEKSRKDKIQIKLDMEEGDNKSIFTKQDVINTYETILLNKKREKENDANNKNNNNKKINSNNKKKNMSTSNKKKKNKKKGDDDVIDSIYGNDYEDFEPNTEIDEMIEREANEALKNRKRHFNYDTK